MRGEYNRDMRVAFFEVTSSDRELFKDIPEGVEAEFYEEPLSEETVSRAAGCSVVSVFVHSHISRGMLEQIPDVRCILTRSTGFDHIDCVAARERGVVVSYVPAYGAHTVAEFAFALILGLSRRIIRAQTMMAAGNFRDDVSIRGFDLFGKTLGVIGTGKIGKNVVRIAQGFGMRVVMHDAFPDEAFAHETGAIYLSLSELLARSDIVTLHAPSTAETRHMINPDTLAQMKSGAHLINTARGELVDTEALLAALTSGHLAGAGLDVLEAERALEGGADDSRAAIAATRALIALPSVIATSHVAFFTREAVAEIIATTIENLRGFIRGEPQNLVP